MTDSKEPAGPRYWWESENTEDRRSADLVGEERTRIIDEISRKRAKVIFHETYGDTNAEAGMTAQTRFEGEFSDLCADPFLDRMRKDIDQHMVSNGDDRPHYDRYEAIGLRLRRLRDGGKLPELKSLASEQAAALAAPPVVTSPHGKSLRDVSADRLSEASATNYIQHLAKRMDRS